jgi:hypothetical protein
MRYHTAPLPGAAQSTSVLPDPDANICSMAAGPCEPRKCYRCGETKPAEDFAWKRKAKGQRDSFLPAVPIRLWPRALPSQSAALHRSGSGGQTEGPAGANAPSDRVLRVAFLRRLRGDGPGRSRVRPPAGQVVRRRSEAHPHHVEDDPGRDRQVRGRVRELPPSADCPPTRFGSGRTDAAVAPDERAGDRDRTGDRSLEGSSVTNYTTPAERPILVPDRAPFLDRDLALLALQIRRWPRAEPVVAGPVERHG